MELTKAEEQVMQVIWKLKKALIHDIIDELPNPKPAYTTVSTIVRILEKKGFVHHKAYGKTHEYFPLISKKKYSKNISKKVISNYFEGSLQNMVSFFVKEKEISVQELESILQELKKDSK